MGCFLRRKTLYVIDLFTDGKRSGGGGPAPLLGPLFFVICDVAHRNQ